MSPSPFRSAAVVCSIMTATLGVGVLSPVAASAATSSDSSSSPSSAVRPADSVNPDLDDIPINPSIQAPTILSDSSTLHGARSFVGNAGQDAVWLLEGNTVRDHSPANSGVLRLIVQDRHEDADLEVIRVHTAADGTQTRTARIPMPRTIQVPGLRAQNKFTPGPRTFSGTATAGATVVATDAKTGRTLFTAKAAGSGNGAGDWSAETDLAADTEYAVGFTQTTTSGRTNSLLGIDFTPMSTVPAAPTVSATERRLDGSFALSGTVEEPAASVVAEDEAGKTLGSAEVDNGHFAVQVPQDHLGSTVYVVAETTDHTPSQRTAVRLEQLPTSSTVTKPILKDVFVHPNGDVQVVGKFDGATGRWILQGDRVLAGIPYSNGWSWTVKASDSGEQVDVANLGFDSDKGFSSLSERVALPRLLKVDGITETNTYTPGEREFSGSAEAGATIAATDATGKELFSTKASGTRAGVGTWKAAAELTSRDGYEVTFTQTTADGRKSVMRDIAFAADEDATPRDLALTSHQSGTFTPGPQRFTGTATPGATVTFNPAGFDPSNARHDLTTKANSAGVWTIERSLADWQYKDAAFRQDADGDVVKQVKSPLAPEVKDATSRDLALTSHQSGTFTPGPQRFTGTATPGATVTFNPAGFDPSNARYDITTQANSTGVWTIERSLADWQYKDAAFRQDADGDVIKQVKSPLTPKS